MTDGRPGRPLGRWVRLIALAVLLVCAAPAVARAGTAPVLAGTVSSATDLSGADAVAVSGNYAYTTAYNAGELTAVDISNPQGPTIAGNSGYNADLVAGANVTVAGGYAFVVSKNRNAAPQSTTTPCDGTGSNDDGTGNSLTILSLANPAQPSVVGTVRSPTELFGAYGVAVSGSYAYVAYQGLLTGQPCVPDTSKGGFTVIDITSKSGPQIVGNVDNSSLGSCCGGALNHATSVAISGHYAYTNSFNNGDLTVVDISNPAAPTVVKRLVDPNLTFIADVGIQGHYLYAADQAGSAHPQFTVVDISNPLAPTVVATINNSALLAGAYRIRVSGDFAYLAASSAATVAAIDISSPLAPRIAGTYTDTTNLHSTTGIDLSANAQYAVAVSPLLKTETNVRYPPYPLSGGPTNTGTLTVVQLDPNPISVAIATATEPPSLTAQTSATFSFATDDDISAVQCQLDGAPLGPCTSPTTQTYSGLVVGQHTFTVEAIDSAGRTATDSYTWTVGTAPTDSGAPAISDPNPVVGESLSATSGTWSGYPAPTYTYQWSDCSSASGCTAIQTATGSTYTVQGPDAGQQLEVTVTASNGLGSPSATSPLTNAVTEVPSATVKPAISDPNPAVGESLSATSGTWSGYPAPTYAYQWSDCSTASGCTAIQTATGSSYTVQSSDAGQQLEVTVTASNGLGSSSASSSLTNPVTEVPSATVKPAISDPNPTVGESLSATSGMWSSYPAALSYTYQWSDCSSASSCTPIQSATSSTYTVQPADAGQQLEVTVTATNSDSESGSAASQPTAAATESPSASAPPAISDPNPMVGESLSATSGTWTGYPAPTYKYQWSDCSGTTCTPVTSATPSPGYTVQPTDAGQQLEVTVTASNGLGSPSATSPLTNAVTEVPSATVKPAISDPNPTVGEQLSATNGKWASYPTALTYTYQWSDCSGTTCTPVTSATPSPGYTVQPTDAGQQLEVTVTATNSDDQSGSATSQPTSVVPAPPAPPQNTSPPTIAGTAAQGQTLTAGPGSWTGNPAPSYSYQWERCNQSGTGCAAISGATGQSYVLQRADVGTRTVVAVTASNGVGSPQSASSGATATVTGPPVNTAAPRISGTAVQGSTLTATLGSWTGYPTPSLREQWLRCNNLGETCSAISGATSSTYTLGSADVGHTVRIYVYGSNSSGTTLARSAATAVVAASATGSGTLSLRGGVPTLQLNVQASAGAPAFTRVAIALPTGLGLTARALAHHGIKVTGADGRPVSFAYSLHRGRLLVVLLHRGERRISIALGARALTVAHSVRQHRGRAASVTITLTIILLRGPAARDVVKTPVR